MGVGSAGVWEEEKEGQELYVAGWPVMRCWPSWGLGGGGGLPTDCNFLLHG